MFYLVIKAVFSDSNRTFTRSLEDDEISPGTTMHLENIDQALVSVNNY